MNNWQEYFNEQVSKTNGPDSHGSSREQANTWEFISNMGRDDISQPLWKWDPHYRLSYDGPGVKIKGRLYPPTSFSMTDSTDLSWKGSIQFWAGGKIVREESFSFFQLDDARDAMETQMRECMNSCIIALQYDNIPRWKKVIAKVLFKGIIW